MKKFIVLSFLLFVSLYLVAQITVISPNGGETWVTGNTYQINWTYTGLTGSVIIYLVSNNTASGMFTIAESVPIENGSFAWTIPAAFRPGTNYRVRIVWLSMLTVYIGDDSDAPFTITNNFTTPSITVVSPNGGENWQIGSTYPITWTYTNLTGNVRIELIRSATTPNANIIAEVPVESGLFNWTIPNTVFPASFYRVAITWMGMPTVYIGDMSDAPFTIVGGPTVPSVTVVSPNGGERWFRGSHRPIRWISSSIIGSVEIALMRGNNPVQPFLIIAPNVPNNGSFNWHIHPHIPVGRDYRVRIRSLSSNMLASDMSDGHFAILPRPLSVTVTNVAKGGNAAFRIETESDAPVSVTLYNIKGQVVKQLVTNQQIYGKLDITWDGKDDDGKAVRKGVYFVQAASDKEKETRKFIY